ncbi:hypothetical protein C5S29_09385 [ANME-1 cluster archaeon GoMg3.2]|nr:hypothetical protein [ANME-1 cluster archaeon GoMg3.2]
MEKRKAIIFVAIGIAVLVTAMSIGCVDQQQKEETKAEVKETVETVKEDLETSKRDVETGMAIQEIKESEAGQELKEEVEKAVEDVEKAVEKAVEDVGEAVEKLVEEEPEALETVKTGVEGIAKDVKETLTNESNL